MKLKRLFLIMCSEKPLQTQGGMRGSMSYGPKARPDQGLASSLWPVDEVYEHPCKWVIYYTGAKDIHTARIAQRAGS